MSARRQVALSRLADLKAGYVEKMPAVIAEIERAIEVSPQRVHELTHALAGTAGMYGYAEVSQVAGEIERACENLMQGPSTLSSRSVETIRLLIPELRKSLQASYALTGKKL
jgi:HPt (histidine-containing phosphotransfer) domain-containing protein